MQHSWRPSLSIAVQRCPRALVTGLLQADAARAAGIATGARDRHGRRTRCRLGRSGVARTDERCSNRARRVRPPLSSPSRSMRPRGCRLGRIIGSVLLSERASTQTNKQTNRQRHRSFSCSYAEPHDLELLRAPLASIAAAVRAACTPDAFVRLSRTRPCVGACIRLARVLAPRAAAEAGGGADGKGLSSKRAELLQKRWAPPPLGPASCARAGAGRRGNGSRTPLPPTHALCGARARPPCDGRATLAGMRAGAGGSCTR